MSEQDDLERYNEELRMQHEHEEAVAELDMKEPCRCNCGYRCGGPGRCTLDVLECLQQETGHYVRDCGHDFKGLEQIDEYSYSSVCVHCGLSSMAHDCRVGP